MSKRAEEAALKAYPEKMGMFHEADIHYEADLNKAARIKYIEGYEQAEEDLALTWQDIAKIDDMLREVENCVATSDLPTMGREEYYTEVLNRYNELKRNESKN